MQIASCMPCGPMFFNTKKTAILDFPRSSESRCIVVRRSCRAKLVLSLTRLPFLLVRLVLNITHLCFYPSPFSGCSLYVHFASFSVATKRQMTDSLALGEPLRTLFPNLYTLGARGFLREEPRSAKRWREKIDKRWENLWLPGHR